MKPTRAMRLHWMPWAIVCATVLLGAGPAPAGPEPVAPVPAVRLWVSQGAADIPQAEIGVPLELTVVPASADRPGTREFTIVPQTDGPLTIDARSFDGAVEFVRLGVDGAVLDHAAANAIGWNARLVLTVKGGERLRFGVGLQRLIAGKIVVEATAGEPPLPTGFELELATARLEFECGKADASRDVLEAAIHYHQAGQAFYGLELYADCRKAYEACLPLAEAADHAVLKAAAKGFLGAVEVYTGRASAARELLVPASEDAVAVKQPALEMLCRSALAEALSQLGELAQARSELDRALAIAREAQDTANEAALLSLGAKLAARAGDHERARELFEQARRGAEATGDPSRLARVLNDLGRFHRSRGELEEAERDLLEALGLKTLPATHAVSQGELGNVWTLRGRWSEARSQFEQVLDAARELGDEELEAAALCNLGVVQAQAGDQIAADSLLHEALALEERSPDHSPVEARVLLQLASLRYEQDRLDDSREYLDRAQALADSMATDALVLDVLHQRTLLAAKEPARLDEAGELAEKHVELARSKGSRDAQLAALNNLAWVRHLQGRNDEAAELVARAVEAVPDSTPQLAAAALSTQLDVALARSDLATARVALAKSREFLADLDLRDMDTEAVSLLRASWSYAQFAELEQDVVALGLRTKPAVSASSVQDSDSTPALVAEGFRAAGRAQARALLEGIAEHRSGRRDAETQALRQERQRLLADRQAVLQSIGRSRSDAGPDTQVEPLRERARQLAVQADAVLADLRRRNPNEAGLDVAPDLDPARVQALLAPGEILVQYAEGQQRLYAYVLSRTSVDWRDLGDREEIGDLVRAHLDGMSEPTRLAGPAAVAASGVKAWRALLQPLLPADQHGSLVIVPTPQLAGLPFESLVTADAADASRFSDLSFVLDRYDVRYVPSPAVMSLLADTPARTGEPRMLVLADPVVPGEAQSPRPVPRLANETSWARLPGTRTEALAIVDLLRSGIAGKPDTEAPTLPEDQRGGELRTGQADVFLGSDATAARLRDARRYSIVHVAAHGAVDATDPARSGVLLSSEGEDDGFLSVPEVLELDLDADLVVLSACDTARGAVRRGEGVQSLARAFLYAGAREVVATMWQVDDRETEVAMRSFYKGLQVDGLGAPAALRRARLELRNPPPGGDGFVGAGRGELLPGSPARVSPSEASRPELRGHPYFWAPFVAIGGSNRPAESASR